MLFRFMWGESETSVPLSKISAITESSTAKTAKCAVHVPGDDGEFGCTESYVVVRDRFEAALKAEEERRTTPNKESAAIALLRRWAEWSLQRTDTNPILPPFADTIDLVGSVAQQAHVS